MEKDEKDEEDDPLSELLTSIISIGNMTTEYYNTLISNHMTEELAVEFTKTWLATMMSSSIGKNK